MKYKLFFLLFICLLLFSGCKKDEDRIVIYSSMEENRNMALKENLKNKFPNLDIRVLYMQTGASAAKIKNDKEKVEADIILDLETAYMKDLEDYFISLEDIDTSNFLDEAIVSSKFLPWSKITTSIIINNDYFRKNNLEIPKSYYDLLNYKYRNLIAIPDPKMSSTGYSVLLNIVNLMGEDNAFKYFNDLYDNIREFTMSGSGSINLLKQGEAFICFGLTNMGVEAINEGYDFSIISLDSGSPYNTSSIGIIKKDKIDSSVYDVFNYLINDYIRYDKEYFIPGVILKNQVNKIDNYPNVILGDMSNINDKNKKNYLIDKWGDIYG